MPNHVTNILEIKGSKKRAEQIFSEIGSIHKYEGKDICLIDFEKIIPMPIHIYKGDLTPEKEEEKKVDNWYNWSINNWGTKWNSYDNVKLSDFKVKFNTAWSCPIPIFIALSKKFDDIDIIGRYADEDIGSNCGEFLLTSGRFIQRYNPTERTKDAYEIVFGVRPEIKEEYIFNKKTNNYEYIEDTNLTHQIIKILRDKG